MPDTSEAPRLLSELRDLAATTNLPPAALENALDKVLHAFDCRTGTIHALDPTSGLLNLCACRGIPESLLARIQRIPIGKGMAGIAAERRAPVQICNLQADASGLAQPAARETRMEGSIAVPILDGDRLRGTLGIAKPVSHEYSLAESELLMQFAAAIGKLLDSYVSVRDSAAL